MNILDVGCLLDVERYRRVDTDATSPASLYPDPQLLAPARNAGFLRQCLDRFHEVNFADQRTGRIYLRVVDGRPAWSDRDALARATADADTRAALAETLPDALDDALPSRQAPEHRAEIAGVAPVCTLGEWGNQGQRRVSDVVV